ncbi:MAG: hypothetical protein JW842_11965 [Prolixibacteraceae bacterium]|nr:hypothetical protein [Prolixibacteraceae bacterium]
MGFGGVIFDYAVAVVRWIYGTIWRTIANKPKYKFTEYINGPENSDDWFDTIGHSFVNRVIGLIAIFSICWIIIKLGI